MAIASFLMRDAETGEPFALATVQRDISERLAAETALRELADQRQALLTRLVDAQDAERTRIAADVHDDPVQALAAVDLRLGPAGSAGCASAHRTCSRPWSRSRPASPAPPSGCARSSSTSSRPDLQDGLAAALRRAAEEIFEGTGTRWTVDGAAEPEVPDPSGPSPTGSPRRCSTTRASTPTPST